MQLRDSAMTATGSVQRRRFSEKSSNNAKVVRRGTGTSVEIPVISRGIWM